jgi:hypothetical protein
MALGNRHIARSPALWALLLLTFIGGREAMGTSKGEESSPSTQEAVETTEPPTGELKIRATRNGQPFHAWYEIHREVADEKSEKESVSSDPIGEEGETIQLPPGVYDLQVVDQEDPGKPSVAFPAITIEAGKSVEKIAEFSGGTLKIMALRNGKPFSAWYELSVGGIDQGEEKHILSTNPLGPEGEFISLHPDIYNVKVVDLEDAGSPSLNLPPIAIEAGKTVERIAEFSGGTLKVKALSDGRPVPAWYEVFKAEKGLDQARESLSSNPIGEEGEKIKLPPGLYDLRITYQRDSQSTAADFSAITIEAGKAVERVAEFQGADTTRKTP